MTRQEMDNQLHNVEMALMSFHLTPEERAKLRAKQRELREALRGQR